MVRRAAGRRGRHPGRLQRDLDRPLPPDARLVTLEVDPHHAEVARANLARAGVADRVEIGVGAGAETLPGVEAEGPFDLVFIDADKSGNADYLGWRSIRLAGPAR